VCVYSSPAPRPRRTIADRLRSVGAASLVFGVVFLVVGLGTSGCLFVTHLTCQGGGEGVCSVDAYGLFTAVRHVEVPVREIVEVAVDERTGRRGPGTARVAIVTRSMGRIDLSGGQLLNSSFATNDAVEAAVALRQLQPRGTSRPKDVDLWIGPSRLGAMIFVVSALLCWYLLAMVVRTALRAAA
jgi:hypothetical protein